MYINKSHPWIQIFVIAHEIGREMDISINMKQRYNITTSVGTSSEPKNWVPPPGPPPLQFSISCKAHKDNCKLGKRAPMASSKDKGMQTQAYKNGGKFCYNLLIDLQVYPPPMLHNSSICSPSMGNEGSNHSVSRHMEGQGSIYSLLDGGKLQTLIFLA